MKLAISFLSAGETYIQIWKFTIATEIWTTLPASHELSNSYHRGQLFTIDNRIFLINGRENYSVQNLNIYVYDPTDQNPVWQLETALTVACQHALAAKYNILILEKA